MAYKKILVGTDGSPSATRAVRDSAVIAKAEGGELVVLCVFQPPSPGELARTAASAPEEVAWRITGTGAAEEILERASAEAADAAGVTAKTRIEPGDPADLLIEVADQENADLIVVGNKGMKGVKRFLTGSVPNRISHHAPCDVLIIKTT